MAEGGSLLEDQVNKDNSTSTYQLLQCPICLEQLRSPRSLPCLHSFCEECLSTYIVKDLSGEMAAVTSFPCPVCIEITSPVNLCDSKETWAQHFPTSSLVQYITNHKEMSDTPLNCETCKKIHKKETLATMLCKTKGMFFCDLCKINVHDIFHEVCEIVTLSEANRDITSEKESSITCVKHNLTMDYHCEIHKMIGCKECISTDHHRCDEVVTIKEYYSRKKDSRHDDMKKSLGKAAKCIELIVNALDQERESLQRCQYVGLSSISDIRQRINSYLDKKQEEITHEMILECEAERAKVELSKQLFHRGQLEIRACNDIIDDIVYPSKSVSVVHDVSANLITLNPCITLPLGRICVEEQPCIRPEGIEFITNVDSLSESRAKQIGEYQTSISSPYGMVLMSTENIVSSDYKNKRLMLFSSVGQSLNTLQISGYPNDVCSVDDTTVAVAVSSTEVGIHVVNVEDSKLNLSTVLKMSACCQGLTFTDGKFMVSTSKDIYRVTMDSEVEKVQTTSEPCQHLASDLKKKETFACVPISTVEDFYVTRLPNGIQIYGFGNTLVKNPRGIDVDREGNVYVCGNDSNNVVQVSAKGTNVRELLTSKDGINMPRAISVCGNKFVVSKDSYFEFDSNEIHVYQLY